ncbi:hypothetical protein DFH09DRAFT_1083302 [Mycena vulgaris]|nr:hypothetical protein DFH09DRAFT_1083302 [Mycena vulgaris]
MPAAEAPTHTSGSGEDVQRRRESLHTCEEGVRRNTSVTASTPGHELVRLKARKLESVAFLPEHTRVDAPTSRLCARLTRDFAIQSRVEAGILEREEDSLGETPSSSGFILTLSTASVPCDELEFYRAQRVWKRI